MIGTKSDTEAADIDLFYMVGKRRMPERRRRGTDSGPHTSDHAGMSSENRVRIPVTESLRFPAGRIVLPGLVGS